MVSPACAPQKQDLLSGRKQKGVCVLTLVCFQTGPDDSWHLPREWQDPSVEIQLLERGFWRKETRFPVPASHHLAT